MWQLIKDFFSENGTGSSKRWIAISIAGVLAWAIVFAVLKLSVAHVMCDIEIPDRFEEAMAHYSSF